MAKSKRVSVRMEAEEFDRLEAMARLQHSTVSDVLRDATRAHVPSRATAAQHSAAARAFLDLPDASLPAWHELEREIEARRG